MVKKIIFIEAQIIMLYAFYYLSSGDDYWLIIDL